MNAPHTNNRWAGLSALIQLVALFFVENQAKGEPTVIIPMLLLSVSILINLEGWMKGKGWR